MKGWVITLALVVAGVNLTHAQALPVDHLTPPLHVADRRAAEIASDVTVATAVVLDMWAAWRSEQRTDALIKAGIRYGVTQGATFALKKLVARQRPCAPDACGTDNPDYSFPSGHTATAFAGTRLAFALPLGVSTGGLRIMAGKHWLTDTLAGAGIGLLASRIR
jgi:membrane-associated phospholipid phosphatase